MPFWGVQPQKMTHPIGLTAEGGPPASRRDLGAETSRDVSGTVDGGEIHFAPFRNPGKRTPANTNNCGGFALVSNWCEMDFVHPQCPEVESFGAQGPGGGRSSRSCRDAGRKRPRGSAALGHGQQAIFRALQRTAMEAWRSRPSAWPEKTRERPRFFVQKHHCADATNAPRMRRTARGWELFQSLARCSGKAGSTSLSRASKKRPLFWWGHVNVSPSNRDDPFFQHAKCANDRPRCASASLNELAMEGARERHRKHWALFFRGSNLNPPQGA